MQTYIHYKHFIKQCFNYKIKQSYYEVYETLYGPVYEEGPSDKLLGKFNSLVDAKLFIDLITD